MKTLQQFKRWKRAIGNDYKQVLMISGWRRKMGFIAGKLSANTQWTFSCKGLNSWTLFLFQPHDSLQYYFSFRSWVNHLVLPPPIPFLLPKSAWVPHVFVVRVYWPSQWGLVHLHPPRTPLHQSLGQEEAVQGEQGKAKYAPEQTFASGCRHSRGWCSARQV